MGWRAAKGGEIGKRSHREQYRVKGRRRKTGSKWKGKEETRKWPRGREGEKDNVGKMKNKEETGRKSE